MTGIHVFFFYVVVAALVWGVGGKKESISPPENGEGDISMTEKGSIVKVVPKKDAATKAAK